MQKSQDWSKQPPTESEKAKVYLETGYSWNPYSKTWTKPTTITTTPQPIPTPTITEMPTLPSAEPPKIQDTVMPVGQRTVTIKEVEEAAATFERPKTLFEKGYEFRSYSDSEVILHGYLEYGIEFISKINGMFAISIWDGRKNEVYLMRDRLGIKPLYYARTNTSFVFASEIKALAQVNNINLSLDLQYKHLS